MPGLASWTNWERHLGRQPFEVDAARHWGHAIANDRRRTASQLHTQPQDFLLANEHGVSKGWVDLGLAWVTRSQGRLLR